MVAGQQYAPVSYVCTPDVTGGRPGDGIDNDCDHFVDEELPNGSDDDGDGLVDEDLADSGSSVRDYGASNDPENAHTSASTPISFQLSTTISPSAVFAELSAIIAMEAIPLLRAGYFIRETTESYGTIDVSIASSPLPETTTYDHSAAFSTVAASESTVETSLMFSAHSLSSITQQTISAENSYASLVYTTPLLQSTPLNVVTSNPASAGTNSIDSGMTAGTYIWSSTPVLGLSSSDVSSSVSEMEVSYFTPTDITSAIAASPTFSVSSSVTTIVVTTTVEHTTSRITTPTESTTETIAEEETSGTTTVVTTESVPNQTTGYTKAETTTVHVETTETITEVEQAVETTTETEEITTAATTVATNDESTTETSTAAETTTETRKTTTQATTPAESKTSETTTEAAPVDETTTAAAAAATTKTITTTLTTTPAAATTEGTTTQAMPAADANNEQTSGAPAETPSTAEQSTHETTIATGTTTAAEETTLLETTTELTLTTETMEQVTPPVDPYVGSIDVVFIIIPLIICVVFPVVCLLLLGIKGVVKGRRKKRTAPAPEPEKSAVTTRAPITNGRHNITFTSDEVVRLKTSQNYQTNLANFRRGSTFVKSNKSMSMRN